MREKLCSPWLAAGYRNINTTDIAGDGRGTGAGNKIPVGEEPESMCKNTRRYCNNMIAISGASILNLRFVSVFRFSVRREALQRPLLF